MLELQDITYTIRRGKDDADLIHRATLRVPTGQFMAIVGPSGCGKTTLLKIIAGIHAESDGHIFWNGRDLAHEGDFEPTEIGYVPQFSIVYDHLTVEESVETAVQLRVRTRSRHEIFDLADSVIDQVGLDSVRSNRVKVLSGGQKRRLGLALELVSDPILLLCDEVTSGLDPRSERDIVKLLHKLSRRSDRIVISVTHSLANLELYDSVLVLHEGHLVYHGPPRALDHYFSVEEAEEIYPQLTRRPAVHWHESWRKHRESYYGNFPPSKVKSTAQNSAGDGPSSEELVASAQTIALGPDHLRDDNENSNDNEPHIAESDDGDDDLAGHPADPSDDHESKNDDYEEDQEEDTPARHPARLPSMPAQFFTLLSRRWKIFVRDRVQLVLNIAMLFGFPVLVVIFATEGIDPIKRLSETMNENPIAELQEQAGFLQEQLKTGSLVSGLIMFQVILLTLMGSNNSAREVAGERLLFEKEKLAGLRPLSYLASKVWFLAILAGVQAAWMFIFVETFCQIPGDPLMNATLLILVNMAMTMICLGISALMRSPEQSSLMSVYLVGFQLPLSGAVLALPETVESITRPFISAYWSWSGMMKSLEPGFLEAVKKTTDTTLEPAATCVLALVIHIFVGLFLSYVGCKRNRWN